MGRSPSEILGERDAPSPSSVRRAIRQGRRLGARGSCSGGASASSRSTRSPTRCSVSPSIDRCSTCPRRSTSSTSSGLHRTRRRSRARPSRSAPERFVAAARHPLGRGAAHRRSPRAWTTSRTSAPRSWHLSIESESPTANVNLVAWHAAATPSETGPHDRVGAEVPPHGGERPPQAARDAARAGSGQHGALSRRELPLPGSWQVDAQHDAATARPQRRPAGSTDCEGPGEVHRRRQDARGNRDRGPGHARHARHAGAARLSSRLDLPQAPVDVDARRRRGHARHPRLRLVRRARRPGRRAARDGAQPGPERRTEPCATATR